MNLSPNDLFWRKVVSRPIPYTFPTVFPKGFPILPNPNHPVALKPPSGHAPTPSYSLPPVGGVPVGVPVGVPGRRGALGPPGGPERRMAPGRAVGGGHAAAPPGAGTPAQGVVDQPGDSGGGSGPV